MDTIFGYRMWDGIRAMLTFKTQFNLTLKEAFYCVGERKFSLEPEEGFNV